MAKCLYFRQIMANSDPGGGMAPQPNTTANHHHHLHSANPTSAVMSHPPSASSATLVLPSTVHSAAGTAQVNANIPLPA